jgi:dephospho-CoA kinase
MKKIIIGLTGTFGSGKSTAANLFAELGALTVDADKIAHEALLEGSPVYGELLRLLPGAESSDGLNRKKIAEIVFKDAAKRKALEAIVHPYVMDRISEEIAEAEEQTVVLEVPLLFESGLDRICNKTVTVDAPAGEILERLREKGYTEEQILDRQAAQWPAEEKKKRADFVINNAGSLTQTKREVEKIWKDLHTAD